MKLLPKFKNNPRGFTLIELLVVVAIIAILSLIGLTLFSGVQKSARDAKRKGDIDAIAKALEANYSSATATYPAPTDAMFASGGLPKDPNGSNYLNIPAAGATWKICADLETDTGNDTTGTSTGTGTTTGGFYCRKNAQ